MRKENPSRSFSLSNQHRNPNKLHIPYQQIWRGIIKKMPTVI